MLNDMAFDLEEVKKIKSIVESIEKDDKNPFLFYKKLISAVNKADFIPRNKKNDYNEIEKKNKAYKANRDYCLLSSKQLNVVGFYKSVEVIQIFLIDKTKDRKNPIVRNIYSLFTYCEKEYESTFFKYLSKKLIPISKDYSVGILQGTIKISEADECFFNIQNGSLFINKEHCLISPKLFLLPKNFIPKNNTKNPSILNNIIKPNYWGDCYLIEFFDEEKNFFNDNPNSRKYIEKICDIVKNTPEIKINLSNVRDRFGNIIFQFPITIYNTIINSLNDCVSVEIEGEAHPSLTIPRNLLINVKNSYDDSITGDALLKVSALSFNKKIELGDNKNLEITIRDHDTGLLIHNAVYIPIESAEISMNMGVTNLPPRIIMDRSGAVVSETDFLLRDTLVVGKKMNQSYETFIRERSENNDIIRHSDDYLVVLKDGRAEALEFITKKINGSGIKEICLWDPYLSAKDIIDSLYSEKTGVPFRCITSYKKAKLVKDGELVSDQDSIKSFLEYKQDVIDDFTALSNNFFVNLKFLAQHDTYGWDFHDRFLILIPTEDTRLPIVYSLGTSVNILGKTHHTIQKVTNPNIILYNFEKLWEELDNSNCLLIEYKDGELV